MKKFTVSFFTGNYSDRQLAANKAKVNLYVEQHFNSVESQKPDYAHAKVATNASATSKAIARTYAHLCAEVFGIGLGFQDGVDSGGRGNRNLIKTKMPAILLEPLFVSNPKQALIVKSKEGQQTLAYVLAETIKRHFPNGAHVGFSIGHKGKTGKGKNDMGAPIYGGGWEAEFAEIVLKLAAEILNNS